MREQIEVIYENGVLRPLEALSGQFQEYQHLTVTVEDADESTRWLADADPTVSLEAVRRALGAGSSPVSGSAKSLAKAGRFAFTELRGQCSGQYSSRHRQGFLPMGRPNKPWFRESKQAWYATVEGRMVSLGVKGQDKEADAMQAWRRLMGGFQVFGGSSPRGHYIPVGPAETRNWPAELPEL